MASSGSATGAVTTHVDGWGHTTLRWREGGAGRPVVLIHCYPVDGRLFEHQLAAAADGTLRARLIAIDLPGFGQSPVPEHAPAAFSVESLADAIAPVIDSLGGRVVAGGVAIGGSVAAALAARTPNRVRALVLMANRPGRDAPARAAEREATAEEVMKRGAAPLASRLARAALSPRVDPGVRTRAEGMIAEADPRGVAALGRAIASRPDIMELVRGLDIPTLLVAGEDDPFSPPDRVATLLGHLPRARLVVAPAAGHMIPLEAPDATTNALQRFLDEVERGG